MITLKSSKSHVHRSINVFFIEIIIALLFFSVSGAVILKIFAAADHRSRKSASLEKVILTAQSISEVYSATGDLKKSMETVFGGNYNTYDTILLNSDCELDDSGGITLVTAQSRTELRSGVISRLTLVFSSEKTELYSVSCAAYIPSGEIKAQNENVSGTSSDTSSEGVSATSSENISDTSSEGASETSSENVSDTSSEGVSETSSENISDTSSESFSQTSSDNRGGEPLE